MSTIASQITSLTIIYSTVYSGADQWKHQSSASLALVRGIHRWPVNSPHKRPVTQKMFPSDDVIMSKPTIPRARVNDNTNFIAVDVTSPLATPCDLPALYCTLAGTHGYPDLACSSYRAYWTSPIHCFLSWYSAYKSYTAWIQIARFMRPT